MCGVHLKSFGLIHVEVCCNTPFGDNRRFWKRGSSGNLLDTSYCLTSVGCNGGIESTLPVSVRNSVKLWVGSLFRGSNIDFDTHTNWLHTREVMYGSWIHWKISLVSSLIVSREIQLGIPLLSKASNSGSLNQIGIPLRYLWSMSFLVVFLWDSKRPQKFEYLHSFVWWKNYI